MGTIIRKLSYANVMATIAVFVALGGASYAATALPNNSVGTGQLKSLSINAAKLKGGAVTTPKIAKEAVTGAKIKLSTLGTVPSAANAATASTLGGLSSAQVINQAAGQATVNSKLHCPAGTTASTAVCFSAQHSPANWYEAIEGCAKEDMTLPTPAELFSYGRANTQGNPGSEWTGNALSTTEALEITAYIGGYGAAEGKVFGDFVPYHCVGYPTN